MRERFNESEMREERYQAILAAYGANAKHWPEAERAAALRFAAASASTASRAESALDDLLGAYAAAQSPVDNEAAMARILGKMQTGAPAGSRIAPLRPAGRPAGRVAKFASPSWASGRRMMAAGFAFAALAGLAIGFSDGGVGLSTADAADELVVSFALAEG